jgi:hypothetical protein
LEKSSWNGKVKAMGFGHGRIIGFERIRNLARKQYASLYF